jgi:uncharacterized protein (DUF1684 family)
MMLVCMSVSLTNQSVEPFDGFSRNLTRTLCNIRLIEQRTFIFFSNNNTMDARTYEVGRY